jgi:hypothetical protein
MARLLTYNQADIPVEIHLVDQDANLAPWRAEHAREPTDDRPAERAD